MKNKKSIGSYLIIIGVLFTIELLAMVTGLLSWEGFLLFTPAAILTIFIILLPYHIAIKRKHKYPIEVFLVSLLFYPLGFLWAAKD